MAVTVLTCTRYWQTVHVHAKYKNKYMKQCRTIIVRHCLSQTVA